MSNFDLQEFNVQEKVIMKSNASDAVGGLLRLQENLEQAGEPEQAQLMGEYAKELQEKFEVDGDE